MLPIIYNTLITHLSLKHQFCSPESSELPQTSSNRELKWCWQNVDWLNSLLNRATHPKVKTVERGVEVVLGSQAIHFHGHLRQKQAQEYKLSQVCPETTWKHTDQCSRLKRASLLIFTIQKSWATATCSAVATANKTQKESIVWKKG